jgi:hypothetical protein
VVSADYPVVSPWQQRGESNNVATAVQTASVQLPELGTNPQGAIAQHLRHCWDLADNMTDAANSQLPGFAFELPIRLGQAARARQHAATGAGEARGAAGQTLLESITGLNAAPGWQTLAEQELAFVRKSPKRSGAYLVCRRINVPPLLDGQLTEEIWRSTPPTLTTGSPDAFDSPLSRLWLAYDDRFLYLAVDCRWASEELPGDRNSPKSFGRIDDSSASSAATASHHPDRMRTDADHWRLRLDIDRDYQTWFELSVDNQRRIADRLCDMPGWNPRWAVARKQNQTGWQTEAAIPLSELTLTPPETGSAWAISFARQIPHASQNRAETETPSAIEAWNRRPTTVVQGVDASLKLLLFE